MYELQYVKKRKRRKWVAIGGGISLIGVSALAIVAFLGRFVGTFTVSLNTGNVELALSDSSSFARKESYLRINDIPNFHEFTYSSLPKSEVLDSETTDYLTGATYKPDGGVDALDYFKYTFYVKNVGKTAASYSLKINITDNKAGEGSRTLDDTLRVMLYENRADSEEHEFKVYAKRAATHHFDENGEVNFQEPISVSEENATPYEPFVGYAEEFESSNVITTISVTNFAVGEIRRYTLVNWLEGYDLQSNNLEEAPKGARIKLGVEINAYENQ